MGTPVFCWQGPAPGCEVKHQGSWGALLALWAAGIFTLAPGPLPGPQVYPWEVGSQAPATPSDQWTLPFLSCCFPRYRCHYPAGDSCDGRDRGLGRPVLPQSWPVVAFWSELSGVSRNCQFPSALPLPTGGWRGTLWAVMAEGAKIWGWRPAGDVPGRKSWPALQAHIRERCLQGSRKWPRPRGKGSQGQGTAQLWPARGWPPGLGDWRGLGSAFCQQSLQQQLRKTEVSEKETEVGVATGSCASVRGQVGRDLCPHVPLRHGLCVCWSVRRPACPHTWV